MEAKNLYSFLVCGAPNKNCENSALNTNNFGMFWLTSLENHVFQISLISFVKMPLLWWMSNMSILATGTSFLRSAFQKYSQKTWITTILMLSKNPNICKKSKHLKKSKCPKRSKCLNKIKIPAKNKKTPGKIKTPGRNKNTCSAGRSSTQWNLSSAPQSSTPSLCAGTLALSPSPTRPQLS